MSTCINCGSPSFNLSRTSGDMTCNNCGASNYVGSPDTYSKIDMVESECLIPKQDGEFLPNAISDESKK